ncbi:MAG: DUF58 domain-containing protein [Alphaproteobacteria bacterium]|nr:DUF58 domain-containing protein [Alphaproteobacteria bacterium]
MAERVSIQHRAEALSATLPPLLVAAERVAATVAQGVHGRRRVGQGETFWQFRQFEPGDSVHRIDWRESAKSERIYIRETEWEAAQSVWLWRDGSSSMDYASSANVPTKRARADLLLVALAALLVRGGERVSVLGSGLPPLSGRVALGRVASLIDRPAAAPDSLPEFEALPRHAQIVLLGDFLSPLEETQALVARFAASGLRGHFLQILDPAEETLPFAGRVRFQGMEEQEEILISRVEAVRSQYVGRLAAHREGLVAIANPAGWSFSAHRTDRPPHAALLSLFAALIRPPGD